MGKNGYLQRQRNTVNVYRQAEKETYIQFMTDTLILTLNDPAIMGKDVFGEKRIRRVVEAWGKVFDKYHGSSGKGRRAGLLADQDGHDLKGILGEKDFEPFEKRYEWVKQA